MKKMIALALALLTLLPCWATACENAPLVAKSENGNLVFSGVSWWPITNECRPAGIMAVNEPTELLPVQTAPGQWVAGKLPNGWAKYTAAVKTVDVGCQVAGLTRLDNVTAIIFPQYECAARETILENLGDGVEISMNAISACATWWQGDYASTIYFSSQSDGVQIGWWIFNGTDTTPMMFGHFGGTLHFGLKTTEEIAPETLAAMAQAEAQAQAEAAAQAQASAQASAQSSASAAIDNSGANLSGDGCYRNNQVIQFNFSVFGIIKSWLGIGVTKGGGCDE